MVGAARDCLNNGEQGFRSVGRRLPGEDLQRQGNATIRQYPLSGFTIGSAAFENGMDWSAPDQHRCGPAGARDLSRYFPRTGLSLGRAGSGRYRALHPIPGMKHGTGRRRLSARGTGWSGRVPAHAREIGSWCE